MTLSLLLHCDGVNGSTVFVDATGRHNITVGGGAVIDTSQSKFGGASGSFNGTNAYLGLDGSTDFMMGTGDYTIDCWVRLTSSNLNQRFLDGRDTDPQLTMRMNTHAVTGVLLLNINATDVITGTTGMSLNIWQHCAVTRSGSNTRLFLDGTQEGSTYVASDNLTIGGNAPVIGARYDITNFTTGFIDEFRILKGEAAWTANFTPPTVPYEARLLFAQACM